MTMLLFLSLFLSPEEAIEYRLDASPSVKLFDSQGSPGRPTGRQLGFNSTQVARQA